MPASLPGFHMDSEILTSVFYTTGQLLYPLNHLLSPFLLDFKLLFNYSGYKPLKLLMFVNIFHILGSVFML